MLWLPLFGVIICCYATLYMHPHRPIHRTCTAHYACTAHTVSMLHVHCTCTTHIPHMRHSNGSLGDGAGPTGSGKTRVYESLQGAYTMMRENGTKMPDIERTHTFVLNPKCIAMGELYGEFNLATNEWKDGLGSSIIRGCMPILAPGEPDDVDKKWVVFDGPSRSLLLRTMPNGNDGSEGR